MFLTKNHTHYFDKPLTKVTSPRTLPDWNDTDSEEDYQEVPPVSSINYQYNLLDDENKPEIIGVERANTSPKTHYLDDEELQKMANM